MTSAEKVILFKSFWILPPLAVAALAAACRLDRDTSVFHLLWAVPLGVLSWTLIEYLLHRFVFHWHTRSAAIRNILDALHQRHHVDPASPAFLLVRLPYALVISAAIAAGLLALSGNLVWTAGLMSGIWLGFLCYEGVHYGIHRTSAEGGWISRRRRAHFVHHFRNSRKCYGVTTSFWDRVFGSL